MYFKTLHFCNYCFLQVLIFGCLGAAWAIFSFVINFLILDTYACYMGLFEMNEIGGQSMAINLNHCF
jgi:hypothetical protein